MSSEESSSENEQSLESMVGKVVDALEEIGEAVSFRNDFEYQHDIVLNVFDHLNMETVRINMKNVQHSKLRKVGDEVSLVFSFKNISVTFTGGHDVLEIASAATIPTFPFDQLLELDDVAPRYQLINQNSAMELNATRNGQFFGGKIHERMNTMLVQRLDYYRDAHTEKRKRIAKTEEKNKKIKN